MKKKMQMEEQTVQTQIRSGSALFAKTSQSQNSGSLR